MRLSRMISSLRKRGLPAAGKPSAIIGQPVLHASPPVSRVAGKIRPRAATVGAPKGAPRRMQLFPNFTASLRGQLKKQHRDQALPKAPTARLTPPLGRQENLAHADFPGVGILALSRFRQPEIRPQPFALAHRCRSQQSAPPPAYVSCFGQRRSSPFAAAVVLVSCLL